MSLRIKISQWLKSFLEWTWDSRAARSKMISMLLYSTHLTIQASLLFGMNRIYSSLTLSSWTKWLRKSCLKRAIGTLQLWQTKEGWKFGQSEALMKLINGIWILRVFQTSKPTLSERTSSLFWWILKTSKDQVSTLFYSSNFLDLRTWWTSGSSWSQSQRWSLFPKGYQPAV